MSSNASASRAAIRLQSSSSEGSTVVSSEAGVSLKRSAPGRCYNFPTCLTKQPEHSFTCAVTLNPVLPLCKRIRPPGRPTKQEIEKQIVATTPQFKRGDQS